KLIIDEVTLNEPHFEVVRSKEGIYNMPPIHMPQNNQATYVNEKTGQQWQIHIENWRVRDGVLSYKDLKSATSHAIYRLNMQFKKLHINELSPFRLSTIVRNRWGKHISDLEIRGYGEINFANFNWEKFSLQNFKTRVEVFRKPVDLQLQLENLRAPSFSVQAKVPELEPDDLSVFEKNLPAFHVPQSTLTARGHLNESYTQLGLDEVLFETKQLKASASGNMDFAAAPLTMDLKLQTDWTNLEQLTKYYPALSRFALKGQGQLTATLARQKGKYTWPQLEINGKKVWGSFWGFEAENVSGQFIAKQNFADLYARITDGRVQVANSTFDKLNLSASYRKGNVYGYFASALLNDVPLKLRLSINDIKKDSRTIDTSIYLKEFNPMSFIATVQDFADVISAISGGGSSEAQTGDLAWMRNFRDRLPTFMPNFSGTLYADTFTSSVLSGNGFNAEFDFTGMLPGGSELNGTLDMKLEKGIIHQMEKVAEEQQALNVTYTPFIMLHRMETSGSFKVGEVLKDVAVDEMAVSVDFKNGTMIINNAFTQGPVISAAVSGWVDWVRETFELVIWTMITPSSRRGILAENLTDENGNPALAFKVSSSMLKPKLDMLRAKKTNTQIQTAVKRGLRTEFKKSSAFVKGDFHAKK
ncbi:MAG: hypothetical protein J6U96_04520, partial [Elusimicrobiaceae bacterium]|nr:hypothetical protein [Elusimicrobiaceae bacterium]